MSRHERILGAAIVASVGAAAHAGLIDFENGFTHGSIVTTASTVSDGLTIDVRASNNARDHGLATIFDSTRTRTSDPDLEDPWSTGNIPANTVLGNMLIIAENDIDRNNDGILDDPDDEGSRPAGTLTLEFGVRLEAFSMDLIDIDGTTSESGSLEFIDDGTTVGTLTFAEIAGMDATVVFGDNSANRLPTITSARVGSVFDTVAIHMGGSGALDNISFQTIPAPATAVVLLAGFARRRAGRR